jgi:peptide deformylase
VDIVDTDYEQLREALVTSACYLQNYAANMSCITPVAYGMDLRIISLRNKMGEIIHLINPDNVTLLGKGYRISETSTLLPNLPPASVERPTSLTIEYYESTLSPKRERFVTADAFCIDSSLDLFNYAIPQLAHTHDEKART